MQQNNDQTKLQEQIDLNLKRVYQEALDEQVPDRFQELLNKLRQKEEQK